MSCAATPTRPALAARARALVRALALPSMLGLALGPGALAQEASRAAPADSAAPSTVVPEEGAAQHESGAKAKTEVRDSAAALGTLFMSPEERSLLEQLRYNSTHSGAGKSNRIVLDGYVHRSGGRTTTWINQQPQNGGPNEMGVVVKKGAKPPSVGLQLRSGQNIMMKPGQIYDLGNGKLSEVYDPPPEEKKDDPAAAKQKTK